MALVAQLAALLPLPRDELAQILDYAATLSPDAAAEHLSALLGDAPAVVEFISAFNARRQTQTQTQTQTYAAASRPPPPSQQPQQQQQQQQAPQGNVPKQTGRGKGKKQKPDLHVPQPRRVEDVAFAGTAYQKRDHDDYIPRKTSPAPPAASSSNKLTPASTPAISAKVSPSPSPTPQTQQPRPQPASRASSNQGGYLISDGPRKPKPSSASSSTPPSRAQTPKSAPTKINITGGTPMTGGASTVLADLDAAIRALELSTNPSLTADAASRRCNCVATRHPLQKAAPNCTSCGKVICVREGLGPCTFCGTPLLTPGEVQDLIRELRDSRGREKQALTNQAQRRADSARQAQMPSYSRPRTGPGLALGPTPAEDAARAAALAHRDKLLAFQADNAQRTTIRDEAADFDVSLALADGGGAAAGMWGSREERARELRRQQEVLREMEWNMKPEWEKRTQVLSIDVVGGKVVRRMAKMERPEVVVQDTGVGVAAEDDSSGRGSSGGGGGSGLSNNPLMGALIRPVYKAGLGEDGRAAGDLEEKSGGRGWRRVQDDEFDDSR